MESRAKFLGHSLHQMLIVFPLGLLGTSVVFDGLYLLQDELRWLDVSFWMIAAGIVGGLVAAVFGVIDWSAIPPGTRASRIGLWHGLANVVMLALFAVSWFLRLGSLGEDWFFRTAPGTLALALSFGGFALSLLGGWLGGELVDRLGVGVDPGAHLDAPNSLSGRPASESAPAGRPRGTAMG